MTPEQIAALTAISTIVSKIGTWPIGSMVAAIVFGPWIFMFVLSMGMERRHKAQVQMYADNVVLVKSYEKIAEGLQSIVVLSTQVMTEVKDRVDSNLFCPLMRKDPKVERDVEKKR